MGMRIMHRRKSEKNINSMNIFLSFPVTLEACVNYTKRDHTTPLKHI